MRACSTWRCCDGECGHDGSGCGGIDGVWGGDCGRVRGAGRAVVLNAGYGISGAIEDTPVEAAKAQFNTNFFGVHRMVRAVLPGLRARGGGRLIVIGSVSAQIPVPFQAFYSASKAAVASYVGALRMEVAAFGVDVTVVEPGDHKTAFGAARPLSDSGPESAYQPQAQRAVAIMEASELAGAPASDVARLVVKIAGLQKPKARYVQANRMERLGLVLQRVLPPAIVDIPTPSEADAQRELMRISAQAMGVATGPGAADGRLAFDVCLRAVFAMGVFLVPFAGFVFPGDVGVLAGQVLSAGGREGGGAGRVMGAERFGDGVAELVGPAVTVFDDVIDDLFHGVSLSRISANQTLYIGPRAPAHK